MNRTTLKYSFFLKDKYQYILERSYEPEILEEVRNRINFFSYWYISFRQLIDYLSMSYAKSIFVLSQYAKEELKYIYGLGSFVVQGAIDSVDVNFKSMELNGRAEGLKILSISRLEPQKRIDQALIAFSEILKQFPSAKMFIGGTGPEEDSLKKIADELAISDHVFFLGYIPDEALLSYYASADVFLSLDWADFNITPYEALAVGTKVVVSEEGEFDHQLTQGGYIFYVNPKDTNAIVDSVCAAYVNNANLSPQELRKILNSYTWTNYCRTIADITGISS
jgi:glycosyltransferase involved in cell wall biosynthesis